MVAIFAIILVIHGLIHLLGFAKAFGLAALPRVNQPISAAAGLLWLLAGGLFLATAIALYVWPRGWWAIGTLAVVLSAVLVGGSWADAKYGAVGNVIVIVGVAFGFLAQGPMSLRAAYDRDVMSHLRSAAPSDLLTEADLASLPPPVQKYLRTSGVIGHPRVHDFFVRASGRIRNGPNSPWIMLTAEQHNFVDPPARLFYISGSMFAVPIQGYHRYIGPAATMTVKAAALVPVVDVSGPEMNQSETVTLFNDMCVMAPATLISRAITWEAVDAHSARAAFTNAGHTIHAELTFNDAGELTNFWSDDRYQADGRQIRKLRWSTPLWDYRGFGPIRLAARGEGRWHDSEGDYAYIQLSIEEVRYNLARP